MKRETIIKYTTTYGRDLLVKMVKENAKLKEAINKVPRAEYFLIRGFENDNKMIYTIQMQGEFKKGKSFTVVMTMEEAKEMTTLFYDKLEEIRAEYLN